MKKVLDLSSHLATNSIFLSVQRSNLQPTRSIKINPNRVIEPITTEQSALLEKR